ncbi:MAG TPA: sulfate ABC transporter ATP-binding protein [Chromatiaceae bacterium]|jgi:sulfate transport system ATP-binding protein|nr:sulfate ABC transporter ATP-binding protein [Chromatiaceae bacterium]
MSIEVRNLVKRFGSHLAVDDVSFDVGTGELVACLGPSGSGKSTVLRIIAGLETADAGTVHFHGERADHLHARSRRVGFVFQHYALFRHMTVAENIAFGLQVQGAARTRQVARVDELLGLMGLTGLGERYPGQLSGGQRQRVALARALAPEPKVLLLDEPFGAVDAKVREELRHWLRRMHDEVRVTSIFVTHDQEEAFSVADKVIVIHAGGVEQVGSPNQILDEPATEFVAKFIGEANVYDGRVREGALAIGALSLPTPELSEGTEVCAVLRLYDLKFWRDEAGQGTVVRMTTLGDRVKVEALLDGGVGIFAQFPRRSTLLHGIEPGCRIHVEVTLARVYPRGQPVLRVEPAEPAEAVLGERRARGYLQATGITSSGELG